MDTGMDAGITAGWTQLKGIDTYADFKKAFDREISRQTEGFVRMGYLLKVARDTNILYESGYKSVSEFAAAEYKLSADTVSRMMAINDRYSRGGYSEELDDKYRKWGTTLLAEMLTLPDAVIEALPEGTKREKIRELKKEYKEEQRVTPLEVALEEPPAGWEPGNTVGEFLKAWYTKEYVLYEKLWKVLKGIPRDRFPRLLETLLAPSGQLVRTARIPQKGKYMLTMKQRGGDLTLVNMRSAVRETCTYSDFVAIIDEMTATGTMPDARQAWTWMSGEPWPEQEKPDIRKNRVTQKPAEEKRGKNDAKEAEKEGRTGHRGSIQGNGADRQPGPGDTEGAQAAEQVAPDSKSGFEEPGLNGEPTVEGAETEEIAPAQPEMAPVEYQTDIAHDFPDMLPEGYRKPEGDERWQMERRRLMGVEERLWEADQQIRKATADEMPPTAEDIRRMIVDLDECIGILKRVLIERR